MLKLVTEVENRPLPHRLNLKDGVIVLGSCFADNIGARMQAAGFNVCVNPFGTLYNPASIAKAVGRLDEPEPFTLSDCVEMGAGAGLVCSFSHHTSFARPSAGEFLSNANASLAEAAEAWRKCNSVIITLGTAFIWKHESAGVVCNCLKRPAYEFVREMLDVGECAAILNKLVSSHPEKNFIFTVSPIRHIAQSAHENTLSKSVLHLALPTTLDNAYYFPAYEIVIDELRDYRFYAEDLCHPSRTAIDIVWEKFLDAAVEVSERGSITANGKAYRHSLHRPLNHG